MNSILLSRNMLRARMIYSWHQKAVISGTITQWSCQETTLLPVSISVTLLYQQDRVPTSINSKSVITTRSLKRPKIRNHGCGDSGFSFSVSLTSKYLISTGYSINSDCPIINIRQNGQKLDFIGTLKASEIDRIRTMIVKEDVKTGMITIYTGGDECLTIFRQVEETEKDSIYALRLKSVRLKIPRTYLGTFSKGTPRKASEIRSVKNSS